MADLKGKIRKDKIESLAPGRHGDGNGLFLVVTPAGNRYWIARLTIRGQRNANGGPLRTDIGLGSTVDVTQQQARAKVLEYRQLAYQGVNPKTASDQKVPTFREVAQRVHTERLPTWRNPKHGDQFINTLTTYAFPYFGNMRVSDVGQPEIMACLSPIWTTKHETAQRVAQRVKTILDYAASKGHRKGENPVTMIKNAKVLPAVKKKVRHHPAMKARDVPAFYADLCQRPAISALALRFTCLTASRTTEVLLMKWGEVDTAKRIWTCPEERMKGGEEHMVPLTDEMLAIIEPLRAMKSEYVFEGQKRHKPLSNMAMLNLLDRMDIKGITVHGFRSTFRSWASESAKARFEAAEMSLAHKVGNDVSQSYDRTKLLDERRELMAAWSEYVTSERGIQQ